MNYNIKPSSPLHKLCAFLKFVLLCQSALCADIQITAMQKSKLTANCSEFYSLEMTNE